MSLSAFLRLCVLLLASSLFSPLPSCIDHQRLSLGFVGRRGGAGRGRSTSRSPYTHTAAAAGGRRTCWPKPRSLGLLSLALVRLHPNRRRRRRQQEQRGQGGSRDGGQKGKCPADIFRHRWWWPQTLGFAISRAVLWRWIALCCLTAITPDADGHYRIFLSATRPAQALAANEQW